MQSNKDCKILRTEATTVTKLFITLDFLLLLFIIIVIIEITILLMLMSTIFFNLNNLPLSLTIIRKEFCSSSIAFASLQVEAMQSCWNHPEMYCYDYAINVIEFAGGWRFAARLAMVGGAWKAAVHKWRVNLRKLKLRDASEECVLFVACNCLELRSLSIEHSRGATNMSLLAVARRCRQLEHLNLGLIWGNAMHADVIFGAIAKHCPKLERLGLLWAPITDLGVTVLAECLRLRHLDFTGCKRLTDEGLGSIARYCLVLETLYLDDCTSVTDPGVELLLVNCSRLLYLSFADHCPSALQDDFVTISDVTLENMVRHRPELRGVNLSGCQYITDWGLIGFVRHMHNLETLKLQSTNHHLGAIAVWFYSGAPRLLSLSLLSCDRVNSFAIKVVTENCPNLEKLNLASSPRVDDQCVHFVTRNLNQLKLLDVSYCHLITDSALQDVIHGRFKLERLCLFGCSGITRLGVANVRHRLPNLHVGHR